MILETERLYLREMVQSDFDPLCKILKDEETMYAYEGAFDDWEVQEWLDRQIARYHQYGFGLWAAVLKETGEMIGQCGLTMQPWKDKELLEIGYLFQRSCWHKGYAAEAAKACKKYAFEVLHADMVCSIIRDSNIASQNVAIRNGMVITDKWTKHYRGIDMPHYCYVVQRQGKMDFRLAVMQDLPQLKSVYRDIIQNMDQNQIQIWDEIYPCEFFSEDIRNDRLYVLTDHAEIISAFALCDANPGERSIEWEEDQCKALYLDRLGVNVDYSRKGIGSLMLEKAKETAKKLGAEYLRLFVVDINKPAIHLYMKNGFVRKNGVYDEVIEDDLILHEYGFEVMLS